jgi:hypothetical protein
MKTGNAFRLGALRTKPMPTEASIYNALQAGRSLDGIAEQVGLGRESLRMLIRSRLPDWQKRPPREIQEDARRIVVTCVTYTGNAYRTVSISLPRISMHVAAREGLRHV